MPRYFTGSQGKGTFAGTDVNVIGWDVTVESKTHEVTHSGSLGFEEFIYGNTGATGTVRFNWDAAANPTTDPPNLNPRGMAQSASDKTITGKLYLEKGTGPFFDFAKVQITNLHVTSETQGGSVTCEANFKSVGTFTMPSGNF